MIEKKGGVRDCDYDISAKNISRFAIFRGFHFTPPRLPNLKRGLKYSKISMQTIQRKIISEDSGARRGVDESVGYWKGFRKYEIVLHIRNLRCCK